MKRFSKVLILAGLAISGCAPLPRARHPQASRATEPIVRVSLLENAASAEVGGEGNWTLQDGENSGEQIHVSRKTLEVRPAPKGLACGESVFGPALRARPARPGEFLKMNGRRYRGFLIFYKQANGKLLVINELGIEDYLRGILPKEVSASWAFESLKAQAVVSRTFALSHMNRHAAEGFNLCSTVHCQVYGGLESELPETNRAVEATWGEAVLYNGELANTVFFSNCGGRTEDPRNAWQTQSAIPYLRPVRCGYCRGERHYAWSEEFSQEDLSRALKGRDTIEPPIRSISVSKVDASGRALFLNIKHAGGTLRLRASDFRMAVGANRIRSTLISRIKRTREGFLFKGKGWGHGVGMCQEGAKRLAEKGTNYKKIIRFYYPGTRVQDWQHLPS